MSNKDSIKYAVEASKLFELYASMRRIMNPKISWETIQDEVNEILIKSTKVPSTKIFAVQSVKYSQSLNKS